MTDAAWVAVIEIVGLDRIDSPSPAGCRIVSKDCSLDDADGYSASLRRVASGRRFASARRHVGESLAQCVFDIAAVVSKFHINRGTDDLDLAQVVGIEQQISRCAIGAD